MSAVRRVRWRMLGLTVAGAVSGLVVLVLLARWLRGLPDVASFLASYPGRTELPAAAPVGLPAWLGWQHFLNLFLMVLIIRSGWLIRTAARPSGHWSPRPGRSRTPSGAPTKIRLDLWLHLVLDVVWIVNGAVFILLLVVTGHWMRVVPQSWDIVPNMVSVALQYLSLDWPMDNGWVHYNALQVVAYFLTIFVAAPLAVLTGLRMSPVWPRGWTVVNRLYPIRLARAVHFPVMVYFVLFIAVHVTLVLTTGALRNLNHIYAARDDTSWWGLLFFGLSLAVITGGLVLTRPLFLRPIAATTGTVSR